MEFRYIIIVPSLDVDTAGYRYSYIYGIDSNNIKHPIGCKDSVRYEDKEVQMDFEDTTESFDTPVIRVWYHGHYITIDNGYCGTIKKGSVIKL